MHNEAHGQSSVEALAAAVALLLALLPLISSAQRLSASFSAAVESAAERRSLSLAAASLDYQGYCAPGVMLKVPGSPAVSPGGGSIQSRARSSVREPMLHSVSSDSEGKIHVQAKASEPI